MNLICAVFFQDFILEINELRYRITELENEKLQYEKKLKSTKVSFDKNIINQTVYSYHGNISRYSSFPELTLSAKYSFFPTVGKLWFLKCSSLISCSHLLLMLRHVHKNCPWSYLDDI